MSSVEASPGNVSASAERDVHGALLWITVLGGIGLWMVHLTALASLVEYSRRHDWAVWLMHGLTVGLGLLALLGTVQSRRIAGRDRSNLAEDSVAGRASFLGWCGVIIGATNVLLIVAEGSYLAAVGVHG